jgi:UDP-glucuronate 4-epimerase
VSKISVVTGAAGFIGSHLSRALLARGDRVVGVDCFDPFYDRAQKEANLADLDRARFQLVEADVQDASAMEGVFAKHRPDTVYHLAALAGVRPSLLAPARFAAVNVGGLVSVLEAARGHDCRRIVFASSSSVYGNTMTVPFSEEDDVSRPISPYAATKRSGELIASTYCHLFGLSIAVLRYFTVFGPAQRPDLAISRFMRCMADGEEVPMFGDGTSSRDYTYVDDIVAGTLAAADRVAAEAPGFFRLYNLGGSQPVMLSDMIESIARVTGCTPRIKRLPAQPGDVERTFADLTRSREELGFHPTTNFLDGLARQWEWMQSRREDTCCTPS